MSKARSARVRFGVLRTPVLTYRRNEQTAVLIGCCHIGEQAYYERIHDIAVELERAGAVVQIESVLSATGEELATASAEEAAAHAELGKRAEAPAALAAAQAALGYLGWVSQADFDPEDSWAVTDLNGLEIIRAMGPDTITEKMDNEDAAFAAVPSWLLGPVFAATLAAAFRFGWADREDRSSDYDQVMLHGRSKAAVAAIPPGQDAVLLWGGSHLAGISAGMEAEGFEQVSASWLRVGRLPGLAKCTLIFLLAAACAACRGPAPGPSGNGGPGGPARNRGHRTQA